MLLSVKRSGRFIVFSIQQTRELLTKQQQSASKFVWWGARLLPNSYRRIEPGISRTEVRVLTTELRRLIIE